MSYQALARTYRPKTFADMVGQQHVLTALSNSLSQQRVHHAYLFTGTRGVGKTTIARILAKCFLCETGVTSTPCGTCWTCESIDAGQFVDLIEIDAASRTKVEDTREILDNVQYAPSHGRFKVYVIDEVHMLSTHSFNALLKTLEEPPEHVKFIFATTDPQKLPVTVLSRCLQFNLKNMLPEQITAHLGVLLQAQQIPYEEPALWQIAKAAQGSMRDGLSLLDQAIAYSNLNVTDTAVKEMLGTVNHDHLLQLLDKLHQRDARGAFHLTEEMANAGGDFYSIVTEFINLLQQIAILHAIPDAPLDDPNCRAALLLLAEKISPEDIQLFYQIALLTRRDLPHSPSPKRAFDMMMLRMLTFQPDATAEKKKLTISLHPLENTQLTSTPLVAPIKEPGQAPMPVQQSVPDEISDFFKEVNPEPSPQIIAPPEPVLSPPPNQQSPIQSNEDWCNWVNQLDLQGMAKALAAETEWIATVGLNLQLICAPKNAALLNSNSETRLLIALNTALSTPHTLQIKIQETHDTPAERTRSAEAAHRQVIADLLAQDPGALLLQRHLAAKLQSITLTSSNLI